MKSTVYIGQVSAISKAVAILCALINVPFYWNIGHVVMKYCPLFCKIMRTAKKKKELKWEACYNSFIVTCFSDCQLTIMWCHSYSSFAASCVQILEDTIGIVWTTSKETKEEWTQRTMDNRCDLCQALSSSLLSYVDILLLICKRVPTYICPTHMLLWLWCGASIQIAVCGGDRTSSKLYIQNQTS